MSPDRSYKRECCLLSLEFQTSPVLRCLRNRDVHSRVDVCMCLPPAHLRPRMLYDASLCLHRGLAVPSVP
jgi:hypothetical protein